MSLVEHGSGLQVPRDAGSTPVSVQQRIALGLLARGPLFRYPGQNWQSRAFPGEIAHDSSIRALERRGQCCIAKLDMPGGDALVCRLTSAGQRVERAIHGHCAPAPEPRLPPSVAQLLAEMHEAAGAIEIENEIAIAEAEDVLQQVREVQAVTVALVKRSAEALERLRRVDQLSRMINARRQSITRELAGTAASSLRL